MADLTEGLRILITGAARGIGNATCRRLARASMEWTGHPARILAVDLLEDELAELADTVAAEGGARLVAFAGDVTDPAMPARAVERATGLFGGLDALVNNAGFARHAPLTELSLEQWNIVFDANVRAPWLFAKHAYPALLQSRGAMVVVASISGINPQVGLGAYSASKAAAAMLARHLAVEWAGTGIRVNAVSPGPIHTATTGRYYSDPAIKAARAERIPLRRVGEPEDIAEGIAFLLGPDGSYCSGINLAIDGGLSRAAMLEFARAAKEVRP